MRSFRLETHQGKTKRPRISVICVKPFEIDLPPPVIVNSAFSEDCVQFLLVDNPYQSREVAS
jgi:hypothetical protein